MGSYAIIPAAPVLLDDVDFIETAQAAELRATIRATLRTQPSWALPVETLPPVAGLGGWGIDRGIDTVSGRLLTGSHWVEAVESLTDADRAAAEAVDPAVIIALLHAHSADVEVGPLGSSPNLLLPIDLSAAVTDNAPLAPVDGAADFDAAVVTALTGTAGDRCRQGVRPLCPSLPRQSTPNLAEICEVGLRHILAARRNHVGTVNLSVDEHVHEVRSLCAAGAWA
jgi:hypothetical protein